MHVTEGISPKHVDTNVRFRTTYYFRVFDYCWQANPDLDGKKYRQIIPETDTMYRYRMTGKASALGSRIKFESGTLDASAIDPFGSDAVYRDEIGGYVVRSADEAKAELAAIRQEKAARNQGAGSKGNDALAHFKELTALHEAVSARLATAAEGEQAFADRPARQDRGGDDRRARALSRHNPVRSRCRKVLAAIGDHAGKPCAPRSTPSSRSRRRTRSCRQRRSPRRRRPASSTSSRSLSIARKPRRPIRQSPCRAGSARPTAYFAAAFR